MSLVSDVMMVAYNNENYKLNFVDITMTCDLLVLNFSSNVTLVTAQSTTPQLVSVQGWRKLFITGPAKFNPEHYSIKCMGGR